jgi:hypothetical protein
VNGNKRTCCLHVAKMREGQVNKGAVYAKIKQWYQLIRRRTDARQ